MSGFLIRVLLFFPMCALVVFVCFLLQFNFSLWVIIASVVSFSVVILLIINALLGPLLSWHVRERMRAQARRQPPPPPSYPRY